MPAREDDTVRIGTHPGIKNLRFILVSAAALAAALGAPASIAFDALGAGNASWPLGVLSVWMLCSGLLLLGVSLAYGVVEWNPRLRTATLRRHALSLRSRTVPLDSITEVRRSLSSASNGASYLVYRFVSTEGAVARVLVRGTPMKGLDAAGLHALAQFVDGLPLQAPDARALVPRGSDGDSDSGLPRRAPILTERQQVLAVSLTAGGGSSRAGRETLLGELAALIAAAHTAGEGTENEAASGSGSASASASAEVISSMPRRSAPRARRGIRGLIALFADERRERSWEEDDEEASVILASRPTAPLRRRRLFFRLILASIALFVVAVALAVIIGEFGSPFPNALSEDILFFVVLGALPLIFCCYLAWCATADAEVRHRRRLGRSWVAGRNVDRDDRDLATPLMPAWAEPVSRLRAALGYLSSLVGATAIVAAFIVYLEMDFSLGSSAGILVSGLAVTALGIALLIGVSRQRRSDAEELVLLGGRRLLPPEAA